MSPVGTFCPFWVFSGVASSTGGSTVATASITGSDESNASDASIAGVASSAELPTTRKDRERRTSRPLTSTRIAPTPQSKAGER